MSEYTAEQVEEMVQEAVVKTEKSFGGTFKRLKNENEELKTAYEAAAAEYDAARKEKEHRIEELETLLSESTKQISELAVRGEVQRQSREKGPLPERFINVESIEYSTDPEILRENVKTAVDSGRGEFEQILAGVGIALPEAAQPPVNPTNPPSRDTKTAHDLNKAGARDMLNDMTRRGLLKR